MATVQTLEKGSIFFFYRPRVGEHGPEGLSDISRTYLVLAPQDKNLYRLTIIGRKKLPEPETQGQRPRLWGFVDRVSPEPQALEQSLGSGKSPTTGDESPAARPAGEGVYRILRHGNHTHLVYALELPKEPGSPQETLNIEEQASYIISVKNPEHSTTSRGLPAQRRANFPPDLQSRFEGSSWADVDPPSFLDYEGAEFVLIFAAKDVKEELGVDLHPEDESETSAEIFRELHLDRNKHPVKPLLRGEWE